MVRLLIFLVLMLGFSRNAFSQVAEIYSKLSKSVYESVNGECPKIRENDFYKYSQCGINSRRFSPSQWSDIAETAFWSHTASEEVASIKCAIHKNDLISDIPEMRDNAIDDMAKKIQVGIGIYQNVRNLIFQRENLRQKVNFLRPSGLQKNVDPIYVLESKKLIEIEEQVVQYESLLRGLVESSWNGGSETIGKLFMDLVKKENTDTYAISKSLESRWNTTTKELRKELVNNRENLESQLVRTRAGQKSWNLNLEIKQALFARAKKKNSLHSYFSDTPSIASNMECILEAKYGEGQTSLDNIVFVGTILGSGGVGILSKASKVLKSALGAGSKAGLISESASRVLLYSSMGVASASTLQQIDKQCLAKRVSGLVQNNICNESPENIMISEIQSIKENNCVLAVVMSGAPIPILVGIQKALKGVTFDPKNLLTGWSEKGLEKFERLSRTYGKTVVVSVDEVRALDKKVREALTQQGAEYEVVQKSMVWNTRRRKYDLKLETLEMQLEKAKIQGAPIRGQKIEAEIAALKEERDKVPLNVLEREVYTNLRAGIEEGKIQFAGDDTEKLKESFSLYRVTKLPKKKGSRSFDTIALQHPDMAHDLERLKLLNVDVRIDPSLDVGNTAALFLSDPKKYNVLFIKANSPYHHFKHEMQHAEFEHFISPHLDEARKIVTEGKSLSDLFLKDDVRLFGTEKLKRLESLLKTQNTDLAINETMAVDAQIAQMGFLKVSPSTLIKNEKYALWHQIKGFQEIQKSGSLNSMQSQEYNRTLSKLGMILSYVDGAQAAQNFLKTVKSPSRASYLAIASKLQNLQNEGLQEKPIVYDKNHNLIYQRQDGVWERAQFSSPP